MEALSFATGLVLMVAGMLLLGRAAYLELVRATDLRWISRPGVTVPLAVLLILVGAAVASR